MPCCAAAAAAAPGAARAGGAWLQAAAGLGGLSDRGNFLLPRAQSSMRSALAEPWSSTQLSLPAGAAGAVEGWAWVVVNARGGGGGGVRGHKALEPAPSLARLPPSMQGEGQRTYGATCDVHALPAHGRT